MTRWNEGNGHSDDVYRWEALDIIMHLVKPLEQCCVDVITHLNEFHVLLFFISQMKLSDTDMPSSFFMKIHGIHTFSCKAFVPNSCSFEC